ncbi:xanthine dehydrogenase family protein molybdopterin-binding subunit, partial [Haladaptatus sp.]|uniref:xanthine dehydrogenase family protein molybdopterin-binding subunit n=1 Tax=Haladaptatus sp. TaxID=1973141 RepID=UPI003C64AC72
MKLETIKGRDVHTGEMIGSTVERREDPRLITGDAEYVDDIQYPRMGHLAIKRSQYGHARITNIETSGAEAIEGVLAVYTAADIESSGVPGTLAFSPADAAPDHFMMAKDKVVYQGEPVAAVVAEDRYTARDAVDAIDVDYDRLEAVVDSIEAADDDAPVLHEDLGTNVGIDWETGDEAEVEAILDEADNIVELEFTNQELIPTAMEPRATVARYQSSSQELVVEMTSQNPHNHRDHLADALDLPQNKVRVRSPDVGGGFGAKIHHYSDETITAWCA